MLYSDAGDRIADITDLPAIYRSTLLASLDGSIFSQSSTLVEEMIKYNIFLMGIVGFLMIRDGKDERLVPYVDKLFNTGDPRLQDFVLGVYGHLTKLDPEDEFFAANLKARTLAMKRYYPHNFFKGCYSDPGDPDDQYDPLVPFVSTQLLKEGRQDIEFPDWEPTPEYIVRSKRLFYKIAVDFPAETLRTIYCLRGEVDIYSHFGSTLRTIQILHPEVFWRITRTFNISDCFRPGFESVSWDPRSVRQIREWERFRWLKIILSSRQYLITFEELLRRALMAQSFDELASSLLKLL
ncbi:MAG: hypothetical protein E6J34_23220 [Chloroflexi bacterium]|nr:MAG: hypothetical protein E6J34_23220 [Chloroflexota bacterium]